MRIGFDARTLRDDYPGIGRYVYNLLAALQPELTGDNLVVIHDPTVGRTRYDLKSLVGRTGVETVPFPLSPRAFSQQWQLPRLLAGLRLDLFHSPYYFTAYRGLPCPLVLTLHDLIPLVYPASMPSLFERLTFLAAVRLALGTAARVIVPSQATRADLTGIFATPAGRVAVVPDAAAPVFTPAPEADVRRTRELYRVPARYILHVGTNKPHKNLGMLLAAYQRYSALVPAEKRAALVMVGQPDPRYPGPRLWAAQLGLAGSVLALGSVPDLDLRALYSGASCVAFPSLHEGFGLPVLEAMACGAPVVCSSASALPEAAGDAALLLDPHDDAAWAGAIARLLDDPALQAELRGKGLARAGRFSWAASARATLHVYRSLLATA